MRALIIPVLMLAGCAGDGGAERRAYLASLVGQPETELVRALGVPTRTYETGGRKFLAYDESRVDILPGLPWGGGFRGRYGLYGVGLYGGGFYGAFGNSEVVEYRCETTFELAGGRVAGWQLRGNACG